MRAMPILCVLLASTVFVGAGGQAQAAEPSQDWGENDPGIDEAVSRGIALRRGGNDEAALAVFLDVEKKDPGSVRVLLHISTAAVAVGKWLMAYQYLQKATAHKDDPYYQRHVVAIDNVARTIGDRVGQFRARGNPAGAEVRINGELVGTLPMTVGAPLETGAYMLEVTRPGYFALRRSVTIAGRGTTQEDVELRAETSVPLGMTGGLSTDSQSGPAPVENAVPQTGVRARWITWTLGVVAVAAGATSGIAFAIREQKASEWNDNSSSSMCIKQGSATTSLTRGEACPTTRHDIDLAQGVGIGAGIAAVAFGGAALIHFALTHDGHATESTPQPSTSARCGPGFGTIVCSGSF